MRLHGLQRLLLLLVPSISVIAVLICVQPAPPLSSLSPMADCSTTSSSSRANSTVLWVSPCPNLARAS